MKACFPNPKMLIHTMGVKFLSGVDCQTITPAKWQGLDNDKRMIEIFDNVIRVQIPESLGELQEYCNPDLPWAEDHFQERIGGKPTNPGNTFKYWPYYREDSYRKDGTFTHTYQERFWPKEANQDTKGLWEENHGIRYHLGDLNDLLRHLANNPDTRQAYLPIWFPEDTGVVHKGRVPCTLGYLFNIRNGYLHCTYYLRSCDYIRHFKNDVYLAGRLMQHVWNFVKRGAEGMQDLKMGRLKMDIESFHIFESDMYELKKRFK